MDAPLIYYEISAILLFLVYIPSLAFGIRYATIRFRSDLRRDLPKERLCLSIFVSAMFIALLNIILLAILEIAYF